MIADELAREAVAHLERAREEEQTARHEAEGVVDALLRFTEPGSFGETLGRICEALVKVIGASAVFVIAFAEGGLGEVVASTDPRFVGAAWQAGATFSRALAGRPIASFDLSQIEEWQRQPAPLFKGFRSALHAPLKAGEAAALLVLAHPAGAFFDQRHARLVGRLLGPATQALARARAEEAEQQLRLELSQANAELRREIIERARAEEELGRARELALERELREKLDVIEHQRAAIRALTIPILEVWTGVLCVPVVGFVDEERCRQMTSDVLDAVAAKGARAVVIDITGIDRVEAATFEQFLRVAEAVELLGGAPVLTGVGPEIARTIVRMGIPTSRLVTYRRLRDALVDLLRVRVA